MKILNVFLTISASNRKLSQYLGSCVNSFDEDGYSVIDALPYSDVTEFAQAEEDAKKVSKDYFLDLCNQDTKNFISKNFAKILQDKNTLFLEDADNELYMMYDTKKDIHYFFS